MKYASWYQCRTCRQEVTWQGTHRPAPRCLPDPAGEHVRIERNDDGSFEVLGRDAARAVAVNDLTNADALDYVRERLTALGVDRALARSGARGSCRTRASC